MEGEQEAETRTRTRTRRAILDAAVAVLSKNSGASLSDVAAAAGVGRTTIHRYYPERSDLVAAISRDSLDKIETATLRARLGEGTATEALDRLCQEYFELGEVLTLLFNEPTLMQGPEWEEESESDRTVLRLVERGHAEGSIDPEMPPEWVQNLLWGLLYIAWEHARASGAPRHMALALCLRSLAKSIAPPAQPGSSLARE
ncbi:TetR/AcrR family transcriptional regulator [Spongiactinospora sp. 9N601]|uniref:TetR/AcrR family transcriptional regulator n=1 Tax=Spongiactinospora sp. 9N601 TaxID=3375149 RepID=UPI00379B01B7